MALVVVVFVGVYRCIGCSVLISSDPGDDGSPGPDRAKGMVDGSVLYDGLVFLFILLDHEGDGN